jgi:threonine dehydratase
MASTTCFWCSGFRVSAMSCFAVPSFHRELVKGVATYAYELFTSWPDLDVVYVPIGIGTGICGLITVRDLLGLKTEIVGVVAENAPAFALSLDAGRLVKANAGRTFADGMACRDPQPDAFAIIAEGAARVVLVSEVEIAEAIRIYYTTTTIWPRALGRRHLRHS